MAAPNPLSNPPETTPEELAANYKTVRDAIEATAAGRPVELVAVSKTKSAACVQVLYDQGHRVFGENYVQELAHKAPQLPHDIAWHFIGHLQTNKIRDLLTGVPGLVSVDSVDRVRLAEKLNAGCAQHRGGRGLEVYLQVNTSGQASKSGARPGPETLELASFIQAACPYLQLKGLMTIGMPDYTSRLEDFTCLRRCRDEVAARCGVPLDSLGLSMGMSGDYLRAIQMGASSVRVGTALFGRRAMKVANSD